MKITYKELFTFINRASNWINQNPKETKFKYALTRVIHGVKKSVENYNQAVQNINIDNCATDEQGVILTDANNQFRFTKEGMKARNLATQKLDESQTDVEPYYATEVPELSDMDRESFMGLVLREEAAAASD